MVEVNIECNSGEAPALAAKGRLHRLDPRMGIGKTIHRAMISQAIHDRLRQTVLVESAGKIAEQIAHGRLQRRLRQNQMREMIHTPNSYEPPPSQGQ